jgi:hypothetical protein
VTGPVPDPACSRSQWPRGLRRGSAAARLLGLRVRIPPGTWMSVSCESWVLSDRGLCIGLITRPEQSYRLRCVPECDREASIMRRPWPSGGGCCAMGKKKLLYCLRMVRTQRHGVTSQKTWMPNNTAVSQEWQSPQKRRASTSVGAVVLIAVQCDRQAYSRAPRGIPVSPETRRLVHNVTWPRSSAVCDVYLLRHHITGNWTVETSRY